MFFLHIHQLVWFNTWEGHALLWKMVEACSNKNFLVEKSCRNKWSQDRWVFTPVTVFTERQFSPKIKFKVKDKSWWFGLKEMTKEIPGVAQAVTNDSTSMSLWCWKLARMTFKHTLRRFYSASLSSSSSSLSCIDSSSAAKFSNSPVSEFHIHLICILNSAISIPKSFCGQKGASLNKQVRYNTVLYVTVSWGET